jgi:hypothetical protein
LLSQAAPCHKEQEVLPIFVERLSCPLRDLAAGSRAYWDNPGLPQDVHEERMQTYISGTWLGRPIAFQSLEEIFAGYAAFVSLAHALYRTAEAKYLRAAPVFRHLPKAR